MIKESLASLVDKVIGKTGQLHSPAWWMHRIFSKVDEELTAVDSVATTAKTTADTAKTTADNAQETADAAKTTADNAQETADAAKTTADSNKALLDAITASAVWPKPNDTAPLRIVATQDRLQGVVSRGELVWASEDADVIRFTRAEGGTGTTTVALNTTDKNYSLTLGAGESKAVLPATIRSITTDADNDIEHVRLRNTINYLVFNDKFPNLKTADLAGVVLKSTEVLFFQCKKVTSINMRNTEIIPTNLQSTFNLCTELTSLDVSGWDTSNVTSMNYTFANCRKLTSLDVSGWDTSNVTSMNSIFQSCNSLATLKFGTWDMGNVTTASNMFYLCYALTTVTGTITGIKVTLDLHWSPLTNESAMVFINGLAEVTTAQTITFKATTYATLTEEQIAVATSKGWTVASV